MENLSLLCVPILKHITVNQTCVVKHITVNQTCVVQLKNLLLIPKIYICATKQISVQPHTYVSPSAGSRKAVVSYWQSICTKF